MALNESSILYSFLFESQSVLFAAGEYLWQGTAETPRKNIYFFILQVLLSSFSFVYEKIKYFANDWVLYEILFVLETFQIQVLVVCFMDVFFRSSLYFYN